MLSCESARAPLFRMLNKACGNGFRRSTVLTRDEFAHKSRMYWTIKTGAGGAILTAAVLGFLIGLVVVSQTIYANTMENIEEYATLKALGSAQVARGAHCPRPGFAVRCIRQHFGPRCGNSSHPSRKVADSLDLHALVAACVMVVPSLTMCFVGNRSLRLESALTVEPGGCSVPKSHLINTFVRMQLNWLRNSVYSAALAIEAQLEPGLTVNEVSSVRFLASSVARRLIRQRGRARFCIARTLSHVRARNSLLGHGTFGKREDDVVVHAWLLVVARDGSCSWMMSW